MYLVCAALSLVVPPVKKVSPMSMRKSACSFSTFVMTFRSDVLMLSWMSEVTVNTNGSPSARCVRNVCSVRVSKSPSVTLPSAS